MKHYRYTLEAWAARVLFALLALLPIATGSAIGGRLARCIGPLTRVHRSAQHNLRIVMPHLDAAQQQKILAQMWDNLGRNVCEYAYLNSPNMLQHIEEVQGLEHLQEALKTSRPVVLFSGHFGNWELLSYAAFHHAVPLHLVYRGANNPKVDALIHGIRERFAAGLYDKKPEAMRALIAQMKQSGAFGLLVDQKSNGGIEMPFMGHNAMTSPLLAHLVMRYQPVLLPARCVRHEGCRFRIFIEAPLTLADASSDDKEQQAKQIMQQVHAVLERWIAQDPAQWFWVHHRWPFSKQTGKK
jgi:Kdo2-lipid IVA lauroyltransferase/acyltransferase